jgi:hypothetical protein
MSYFDKTEATALGPATSSSLIEAAEAYEKDSVTRMIRLKKRSAYLRIVRLEAYSYEN